MKIDELIDINNEINTFWEIDCTKVNVYGYQTPSNFDDYSGLKISTSRKTILFYSGILTYDYTEPKREIEKIDGKVKFSFGTTEFGKKVDSRWIIVITPYNENRQDNTKE